MPVVAAKGTSWIMSIIIWFLGLFGITIGGGGDNPETKDFLFLPAGTTLVSEDTTYTGPYNFENIPVFINGNTYTTKDYVYTYNANTRSWRVKVRDTSKEAYEELQTTTKMVDKNGNETSYINNLFGANITDMTSCYAGCTNLKQTPSIPSTVNIMVQTFKGCSSLVFPPEIQNTKVNMYGAFDGCTNIQFPDGYKAYMRFSDSLYPYFTFNKAQQTWIADKDGVFGNSNISNINVYLNLIKSLNFEYAGYPIEVEYRTTVYKSTGSTKTAICTLELYKTEQNTFAWKAVRHIMCSLEEFKEWVAANPLYGNIPVTSIDKNPAHEGTIETEVCSLVS